MTMQSIDLRGKDPRAFDTFAGELSRHCDTVFEAGAGLAARDIERLSSLAGRLGREVNVWSRAIGDLEAGAAKALEARRAGRLLIDTVFDEALIPEASRVLAAAFEIACSEP
jgi:hypothetical protein